MGVSDDFVLPSLTPDLKITRAPDMDDQPFWTLHHPTANAYFKIDWMTFEVLSRLLSHKQAQSLKESIEAETTIRITLEQIAGIVTFLQNNALVALSDQRVRPQPMAPLLLWKKIFHGYLYFTIPLFRPQRFLERTYPHIAFLFSRLFVTVMMTFLALMIILTLPRLDEFLHTFMNMFSVEGAIRAGIVLAFVKIVHEWAHAFTATKYGVDVPHMGVALIVLYPVLYTETTASWQLPSRRARFHIGMAGVVAELCLAAIFLALWHVSPSGSAIQTASFLVVAVSLISSLLVNLNPLMRFDGYYMFSDVTGIDNLQARSCAFARWRLRGMLFGLKEPPPEDLPPHRKKLLVFFGAALLIYRFFLFSGIALLVYHVFFQPLGLVLMMVEIIWFIALPILSELKVWYEKRAEIASHARSLVPALLVLAFLLFIIMPWKSTLVLPAVLHAAEQFDVYAPAPAKIITLRVKDGETVEQGAILAELESPDLETDLKLARQQLQKLEILRRRTSSDPVLMQSDKISDAAILKARVTMENYQARKDRLIITAPFTGVIRDLTGDIQAGRFVSSQERLFTLVDLRRTTISAFATEDEQEKIKTNGTAGFRPSNSFGKDYPAAIASVAPTGEDVLSWPELTSVHGGPIAADRIADGDIITRRSLYLINGYLTQTDDLEFRQVQRGYLRVSSEKSSILSKWIKQLTSLFRREGKIG